jgi:hypothetical protein
VVTFGSHHFRAFANDDDDDDDDNDDGGNVGGWLRFDDGDIEHAGSWREMLDAMVSEQMCPALMFYQRC